jgi:hypothetical protein
MLRFCEIDHLLPHHLQQFMLDAGVALSALLFYWLKKWQNYTIC